MSNNHWSFFFLWIGVHDWIGEVVDILKWLWYGVVVVNLFECGIQLMKMGF